MDTSEKPPQRDHSAEYCQLVDSMTELADSVFIASYDVVKDQRNSILAAFEDRMSRLRLGDPNQTAVHTEIVFQMVESPNRYLGSAALRYVHGVYGYDPESAFQILEPLVADDTFSWNRRNNTIEGLAKEYGAEMSIDNLTRLSELQRTCLAASPAYPQRV